jgi:sortase A
MAEESDPRRGLAMPEPLEGDSPRGSGSAAYLMDAVRLRPVGRRVVSVLSIALFVLGVGLFAYPLFTDVYATEVLQEELTKEFETAEHKEAFRREAVQSGDPLTRIVVPSLDVDALVVEGTAPAALRAGAGHYPNTPLPGEPGNVAIAGHRTTYGKPFNRFNRLAAGDTVRLETPVGTHTYEVTEPPEGVATPCAGDAACWITGPNAWGVVDDTDRSMLTLTTCHPKGSARQRLIVRAELVDSTSATAEAGGGA